jgi:lathosterol oxidase
VHALERLALALKDLPPAEAVAWMALINIAAFLSALAFGHLAILACSRRYAFAAPPALTRAEVLLAAGCVLANIAVNVVGWILWKEGIIRVRSAGGWSVLLDFFVLLGVMDLLMYALHRVAHHRWFYGWLHAAHHAYENPRPLTLFVMNPLEALAFGALWLAVITVYPPTWIGMTAFLGANLVSGMLGHVGVNPFPGRWNRIPILGVISTSAFHNLHHRNPDRNLGFYTTLWDRLFHTGSAGARD